ncbi:hypothetical protein LZG00_17500 [Rhodobacteraceae bacterium LMO-12]|nr:hypothetical protein [Rhodobacteraceae bacterium LMO-JJ12]
MAKSFMWLCLALAGLCAAPTHAQNAVFAPDELLARYMHWQDQQVTIAAYPALFMSPGDWKTKSMEFGANPIAQDPAMVVCESLTPPDGDRITSADLVILRGRFVRRKPAWSAEVPDQIALADCVILAVGGAIPQLGDPWTITTTPVAIAALHEAVFDLVGKTVRVRGFYWGSTWSAASDESRHDIQQTAAFLGPKPIGCFQNGKVDAPQSVQDNRENTVIEGKVALTAHSRPDRVDLHNCRFILSD